MGIRLRRSGVIAVVAMLAAGSGVRADPFAGLVDVDSSGAIQIEAESMETWNGCIEHTANMCDTVCDPFGTTDPKGRNCWESANGSCSGKMGVGLCGTFSFIDFLPVPRAGSFSLRHYNTPEDFTFSIFVNGDPWLTKLVIPPSMYKIQTDSGEVTVKEWKDTLFEDVPLDKDVNFIRIQRTGTGIPLIDYITVYPEGGATTGAVTAGVPYLYEPYPGNGIPEGVVLSNGFDALGGLTAAAVPAPFEGDYLCAQSIADGNIDIIVNMATNKSEGDLVNDTALCLYNHFGGTFVRRPRSVFEGMDILNYMMALNKSEAVIGGEPPRQQLCIVDSIRGNHSCGPYGTHLQKYTIDRQPNRIIMGTCAPIVDGATIRGLRKKMMAHVEGFSARFMIDFGYPAEKWDELELTPVTV